MTPERAVILGKLRVLWKLRTYLEYSHARVESLVAPGTHWGPPEHEALAAFRTRFGDFQEQLGSAMRAVAIEEQAKIDRFGAVLAFMERVGVLDGEDRWRLIRSLRNAVSHEYEEDPERVRELLMALRAETSTLLSWFDRLVGVCRAFYEFDGTGSEPR